MKTKIALNIQEIEEGNYHVFVPMKIGGRRANLLLDTGASKTVFDQKRVLRFVKESELTEHEGTSVGLGVSEMKTHLVGLSKVRIGSLKINTWEVAVLPLDHVNASYALMKLKKIDGVLGSDFLMKYHAVINYKKAELKLLEK